MEDTFEDEKRAIGDALGKDTPLRQASIDYMRMLSRHKYSYMFTWLGRPIIQRPQDIVALQELIWKVRPGAIIETGIARGGSMVFYASMLELIGGGGQVLGIDIDIREHNRREIEAHRMFDRITMFEGSSLDPSIVEKAGEFAANKAPVFVVLDSFHTHDHVLEELRLYAPLVTEGSYLVVLDTYLEDMPEACSEDRPWGPGNNPRTALREFLSETDCFVPDDDISNKLLQSVAPDGYLQCVKAYTS